MDAKANPIPKPGKRNVCCFCYNECLDYAVNCFWQSWNCSQCPSRLIKQSITEWEYEFNDADSYYGLPPSVALEIEKDLVD